VTALRLTSALYHYVFARITRSPRFAEIGTFRAFSRKFLVALLQYREREIVISGLWALAGFKQVGVPATKGSRGASSYTFRARFRLMVNTVASFSAKPLFVIVIFGLAISALSLVGLIYMFLSALIVGSAVPGWASVMISVWFLGGLIILFLGVIGTYIAKIFIETKRRPLTIVRAVHRRDKQTGSEQAAKSS